MSEVEKKIKKAGYTKLIRVYEKQDGNYIHQFEVTDKRVIYTRFLNIIGRMNFSHNEIDFEISHIEEAGLI
jgi:hypothetical protein